jgi:hypothetical protein
MVEVRENLCHALKFFRWRDMRGAYGSIRYAYVLIDAKRNIAEM